MSVRCVFVPALLVLSLVLSLSLVVRVSAEDDTEIRVSKFGQELASAWATYPTEKDLTIRKQKVTDLNNAMNAEMPKANAPEGITINRAIDNFLSNLQKCRSLFKQDKMNGERTMYVNACAGAFRRELTFATDMTADRTASKCFDMLVAWADAARTGLQTVPEEVRSQYYTGLNEVFSRMIKTAAKDADDPTAIYDKQLKDIRRRFPVTGPFQKTNQPVLSVLENAAKGVNTRNKAAQ